jgi:phosphatidylglycerophosphate synthase
VVARPSIGLLLFGIATDWIDGPIARLGEPAPYGARLDIEADSVLTLGAAIAAARHGAGSLLVAPLLRYAAVAARDPRTYTPQERLLDRVTGIAQMAVIVGSLSPWPVCLLSIAAGPVTALRCAALAAVSTRRSARTGRSGAIRSS